MDFDLESALKMGEFEHALGVRSTYYMRPCGDAYNVFGPTGARVAVELQQLGHSLALHVDLDAQRDATFTDAELHQTCTRQWRLMTQRYACSRRVSFHTPPHDVLWRELRWFVSASEPRWRDRYLADSRGRLSERVLGRMFAAPTEWQINLHPEWWWLPSDDADKLRMREAVAP